MGIYLDLSSKWNLTCSRMIAHSLEPYNIMYLEDPMLADNIEAYVTLDTISIPICISGSGWPRASVSAPCLSSTVQAW